MMIPNHFLVLGVALFTLQALSVRVEWNSGVGVSTWSYSPGIYSFVRLQAWDGIFDLSVDAISNSDGTKSYQLSGISDGSYMPSGVHFFAGALTSAEKGDILNPAFFSPTKNYFYYDHLFEQELDIWHINLSEQIDQGESLYLAIAVSAYERPYDPTYGWVELTVDDDTNIHILASAYDWDHGPMIVGGGAYTIPEPSSGLLFLLGLGTFILRRKK